MTVNPGFLAQRTELPYTRGNFCAAASVTTGSEQFVPPGGGAVTSVSLTTFGILVATSGAVIEGYRVQYTGDAANNAGQTMVPKLYYLRAGVATLIPGSTGTAIATTAGQKNGGATLSASFTPEPGDVILASLTPSAGLSAVLTGVMISLG